MPSPPPPEALLPLMVIPSAPDRDMADVELARIGDVVRSWPVFEDFNPDRLIAVAQTCQKMLHEKDGLEGVLASVAEALPEAATLTRELLTFKVIIRQATTATPPGARATTTTWSFRPRWRSWGQTIGQANARYMGQDELGEERGGWRTWRPGCDRRKPGNPLGNRMGLQSVWAAAGRPPPER